MRPIVFVLAAIPPHCGPSNESSFAPAAQSRARPSMSQVHLVDCRDPPTCQAPSHSSCAIWLCVGLVHQRELPSGAPSWSGLHSVAQLQPHCLIRILR
ncbi:hypothetical protein TOPH_08574 [Tolypocladium ophioglossoides CBS 100239]|uniref:Uncharacterized protein n=1 Tax=Tolypocladium ophioglossoides (strain CBS 100239) TaxID=1163406 RepID=A0A0L0MY57_TOLOC|nr:hypothetical protein TOPH_08574 [Tolypocladium ophioglossoides CBS 100239]